MHLAPTCLSIWWFESVASFFFLFHPKRSKFKNHLNCALSYCLEICHVQKKFRSVWHLPSPIRKRGGMRVPRDERTLNTVKCEHTGSMETIRCIDPSSCPPNVSWKHTSIKEVGACVAISQPLDFVPYWTVDLWRRKSSNWRVVTQSISNRRVCDHYIPVIVQEC